MPWEAPGWQGCVSPGCRLHFPPTQTDALEKGAHSQPLVELNSVLGLCGLRKVKFWKLSRERGMYLLHVETLVYTTAEFMSVNPLMGGCGVFVTVQAGGVGRWRGGGLCVQGPAHELWAEGAGRSPAGVETLAGGEQGAGGGPALEQQHQAALQELGRARGQDAAAGAAGPGCAKARGPAEGAQPSAGSTQCPGSHVLSFLFSWC